MKEGGAIILAVVLLLFRCERETTLFGEICITPPICIRNEKRRSYYSGCSVMFWRHCVLLWKRNYFVWDPKEDTNRNQWFSCTYNTVQNSSTQILECVQRILTEDCVLNLRVAYNASVLKDCFYKVEQFQHRKNSLVLLTHCKYVSTDWRFDPSFEPCRVVSRFSDHKCRHGNVEVIIISYVPAGCNTNASFEIGFIVLDTASQYSEGRDISISRLRYSANHNALDSCPIRARRASQNDELCENWHVSERWSYTNVQNVENNVFLTLNRVNTLHYTKYIK